VTKLTSRQSSGSISGAGHDLRMLSAFLRHERKSQSRRRHRENPIIAFAAIDGLPGDALLLEDALGKGVELAIDPLKIVTDL
jgi:hypothetical protein